MLQFRKYIVVLAVLVLNLAPAARAHDFSVLLVSSEPTDSRAVYDGFRLATKERDGHDNETSDGHLGGLDVRITQPGPGEFALDLARSGGFDFVAIAGAAALAEVFWGGDVVVVPVAEISDALAAEFLRSSDFDARFRRDTGYAANLPARSGYVAARLIDRAVRRVGGVNDRAALRAALSRN